MLLASNHVSFYVTDHNSGIGFLVDTGAQVSVITPLTLDKNSPSTLHYKVLTTLLFIHMAHALLPSTLACAETSVGYL